MIPFCFPVKRSSWKKSTNACPTSTHIIEDGKELAFECRFLRCPTVRKFQEHGIKLGRIDPGGVPARIEVARRRLSGHVTAVEVDRWASCLQELPGRIHKPVEELTSPRIVANTAATSARPAWCMPGGRTGHGQPGKEVSSGIIAYNNNVVTGGTQAAS